jgi:hypothetical protein
VVTAEPIAAVVADIRKGRVHHKMPDPVVNAYLLARATSPQPVVDASAIYGSLMERATTKGVNLYQDFSSTVSPWDDALIAYVNTHGNVMVLQVHQEPWDEAWQWETTNEVDWGRVRWLVEASVWVGGKDGAGRPLPTSGPVHLLQNAVYDDGFPADMHWVALLGGADAEPWEMPTAVLNAALDFLACSNVEVAEPKRPFPVRQRLRKTRVQVQTIVVRPPGRRRAHTQDVARPMDELDVQLTSVRGSFARYGVDGRGLLFGKYAGKFWRPAYVRGQGEVEPRDYVLKPASAA